MRVGLSTIGSLEEKFSFEPILSMGKVSMSKSLTQTGSSSTELNNHNTALFSVKTAFVSKKRTPSSRIGEKLGTISYPKDSWSRRKSQQEERRR